MIEYGSLIIREDYMIQDLICSKCGMHLGSVGQNGDYKWDDVEDFGWNYCPKCGAPLFE